jgi:hypothetical protein
LTWAFAVCHPGREFGNREEFMFDRYITLPLPDGPLTVPVYTLPASAFADRGVWEALGDFELLDLPDPGLS